MKDLIIKINDNLKQVKLSKIDIIKFQSYFID
jgi:hypothetical protein